MQFKKLFVLSAVLYMDLDKTIDMWHEICQQQKKLVTSEHKKHCLLFYDNLLMFNIVLSILAKLVYTLKKYTSCANDIEVKCLIFIYLVPYVPPQIGPH